MGWCTSCYNGIQYMKQSQVCCKLFVVSPIQRKQPTFCYTAQSWENAHNSRFNLKKPGQKQQQTLTASLDIQSVNNTCFRSKTTTALVSDTSLRQ